MINERKINNKKGFTLIEILIVVGIILILSTIAVMNFKKMKYRKAKMRVTNELSNFLTKNISHFDKFGKDYILILDAEDSDNFNLKILGVEASIDGIELESMELPDIFYYDIGANQPGVTLKYKSSYLISNKHGKIYDISDQITEIMNNIKIGNEIKNESDKARKQEKLKKYTKEIEKIVKDCINQSNIQNGITNIIDNGDALIVGKQGELLLKVTDAYNGDLVRNIYFKYNNHSKKLSYTDGKK